MTSFEANQRAAELPQQTVLGMEADLFASIARVHFTLGWSAFERGLSAHHAVGGPGTIQQVAWLRGWSTAREAANDGPQGGGR